MRYIFFSFSVKKVFSVKKNQYKFFFHIKLFFSTNNVCFVKNTNIFSKKNFLFQLSFATNEQPYITEEIIFNCRTFCYVSSGSVVTCSNFAYN